MAGDLDMNLKNTVVNLKDPLNPRYTDAVHLSFSDHQPLRFKYLMDDTDDSSSENNSPHAINKTHTFSR